MSIYAGIFLLLIGAGLTLYSYVYRDPATGEFSIWWSMLLIGAVALVAGLIRRNMEDQPL